MCPKKRTIIGTKPLLGGAISAINGTGDAHCKSGPGSCVLFKHCHFILAQFHGHNFTFGHICKRETGNRTHYELILCVMISTLPPVDKFGSHAQWCEQNNRCGRDIYTISRITKTDIRRRNLEICARFFRAHRRE